MNRTGLQVVITGDNRSVMRALKEVSTQSEKTGRQIHRDSATASTSFRKVGESAEASRRHISGLTGMIGLAGVAYGLKDVVSAGLKWQAQQSQLQVALKNTGNNAGLAGRKITDAAERLSTHGGLAATSTLQAMTQFVRISGSAKDAISKTTLATNIARGTGRDYMTIVKALLMAEQGRTTGLSRLGIAIPKVTKAEDLLKQARFNHRDSLLALTAAGYKFTTAQKAQYAMHQQITPAMVAQAKAQDALASKNNVFSVLQQRFGGGTAAYAGTAAGKISDAKNALDIAFKTMSSKLLPVIAKIATAGAAVIMYLIKHKSILITLGVVIGSVTAILTLHKIAVEILRARTYALTFAQNLLQVATGKATWSQAFLGRSAATAGGEVATMGTESTVAGGKMGLFGGGLKNLVGPLGKLAIAAGAAALVLEGLKAGGKLNDALKRHQHGRSVVQGALVGASSGALAGGIIGSIVPGAGTVAGAAVGGLLGGLAGAGSWLLTSFLAPGGRTRPHHFAGGGPVGSDTVPAWLTPREGVVNTRGMGMIGAGGLGMLNSGQGIGQHITIQPG